MHAAREPGQFGDDHVGAGRQGVECKLSDPVGDRRGDDGGGRRVDRGSSAFHRLKCDRDAGQDMSRRIDDRPADSRGRGLSMDRQGAGDPEHKETHEPEQTTHVGRILREVGSTT